jgi:glyoxalase superfamily protein
MSSATFGEHANIRAVPADRPVIRNFFRNVLGAPQTRESDEVDIFRLGPNLYLGVAYSPYALPPEIMQKAIWLELKTADPAAMKEKILAAGGREIDFWDKEHFYFQAPGGQVFRLISDREDMSKWNS